MKLIFKDPPPAKSGVGSTNKYLTDEVRNALQRRSGQWALIADQVPRSTANAIRIAGRRHGFEVVTRGSGPMDVYVRHVETGR